ncbi:MAG: hypothetical protein AB7O47_09100 [Flavobacteriales bacterium]
MERQKEKIESILDNTTWCATEFNFTYKFINNKIWVNNQNNGNYNLIIDENKVYLIFGLYKYYVTMLSDYEIELNDGKSFLRIERRTA